MSTTMNPDLSMPPAQVRRRANDFDSQVRQGLEDGTIRKVIKTLGDDLTGLLLIRAKGTPEQKAAFPRPLFLVQFVRAWNKNRTDTDFVEIQLAERAQFDHDHRPLVPIPGPPPPAPIPLPHPTTSAAPTHPKAPAPRKRHTTPPQAGPSGVRLVKGPSTSPPPERRAPGRPSDRAQAKDTRAGSSQPARGEHSGSRRHQKVEVLMPPRSPVKFADINDTEDKYVPEQSPSPPPPQPRQRKTEQSPTPPQAPARRNHHQRPPPSSSPPPTKGKQRQLEPSPSPSPPPRKTKHRQPKPSQSISPPLRRRETIELIVFKKACVRCERGKRDCVEGEVAAACLACKQHKYKCDKTGSRNEKTMVVTRPAPDSEEEEDEQPRGTKRRAESPLPTKKTTKVKKVKEKEKEMEKEKEEKPKARPRARQRAPPKSTPIVVDLSRDSAPMEVDEGSSGKTKPTPARAPASDFNAEHDKRLAMLEERVKALDKMAAETTRTSQRMDAMEDNVHRFTGALENFLGRIHIDGELRLVPDSRRIGGSHSPSPLQLTRSPSLAPIALTRSASPAALLDIPMDEDSPDQDVASSHPDTRTTPSDNQDVQMVAPGTIGPGSVPPLIARQEQDQVPVPISPPPMPAPLPTAPAPTALPTLYIVPAIPQESQQPAVPASSPMLSPAVPSPTPPGMEGEESAPTRRSTTRARSRTPALLEVQEGRTTRARARSRTPI